MNVNRSEFLQRVSLSLGRDNVLASPSPFTQPNKVQFEYLAGASAEQLREEFITTARAAGTTVYECALSEVNDTLLASIPKLSTGPILLSNDKFWQEHNTVAALKTIEPQVDVWDLTKNREFNIACAEKAAVGLAVAALALAETGTVMLPSHEGCGRSVTLLPTTTLFIIDQKNIVPRLTQAMTQIEEMRQHSLPSAINFISAASSTSDIELVRVQGVHGPMQIAFIIVS